MKKRRQQRYLNTHTRIIAAAVKVISRHGAENYTIDQIAAEAGVSHGAVCDHFDTKADILEAVKKQMLRENKKLSELNPTIKSLQRNEVARAYVGVSLEMHRQRRATKPAARLPRQFSVLKVGE